MRIYAGQSLCAFIIILMAFVGCGGGYAPGPYVIQNSTNLTIQGNPTQPTTLSTIAVGGPYSFSIVSGAGSVNSSTGVFTPSGARATTVVQAIDPSNNAQLFTLHQIPTWLWTNGQVNASVLDGRGNIYLGGTFTTVGSFFPTPGIASLDLTSGNPLTSCDYVDGFVGSVNAIAFTSNAIYVGGSFAFYRGNAVQNLVKLNSNCELDTTFTQVGSGFNSDVYALAVNTTNNSLYVGGDFTQYRGVANNAQYLAKVDLTSGNLDTTFTQVGSGFDSQVNALAVNTANNSLYVGGNFTEYRGVANNAQYLAKVDLTSGNLDTTFTQAGSGFDSQVNALAVNTANNSLYVGGDFTQYRGVANNAQYLAKVDLTSGNLDTTFTQAGSGFNSDIYALAVNTANNSLYVGGDFTQYRGVVNNAQYLAKVDLTSGSLDTTFTQAGSGFDSDVDALAVDTANNSLYAGGFFSQYRAVANNAQVLAKVDLTSGNLDTTFTQAESGFDSVISALAVNTANNSLYVGGGFTQYRGVANNAQSLAKVDLTSGNLDTTFTQAGSGFSGTVNALAVDTANNSLYVGGFFIQYRGVANNAFNLAKVDLTSGNLDTTFTQAGSGFIGGIYAYPFSCGKTFSTYNSTPGYP